MQTLKINDEISLNDIKNNPHCSSIHSEGVWTLFKIKTENSKFCIISKMSIKDKKLNTPNPKLTIIEIYNNRCDKVNF